MTENIGVGRYKDTNNKNDIIEKSAYNEAQGAIFVNDSLYFEGVSAEVWGYKIGGYQVLDKYLKSHKGEKIALEHFEGVIRALSESLAIEAKIAEIALD